MAYQFSGYEGNCSLSLQNCASLYPKTSSLAYGPRFTTASCVQYPYYPWGDVGVCGWKGAPCAADSIGRTNCNAALGSCIDGVCSGALGDPCTTFCLGIIQCGTDSRCGGTGALTSGHTNLGVPAEQICMSGVVGANGRCTAPTSFNPPTPPAPASQLASTALPSTPAAVSALPGGQPGSQSVFQTLEQCAPCGKSRCSFTPEGSPVSHIYSLVIGNPVANCQRGNNQSVKTRYTATMEIEETWSLDLSLGLGLRGMDVEGSGGWSQSKTIRASQEVELTVIPGQLGALVANVSYKTTTGGLKIGSSPILSFVSVQPQTVLNYAVQYADCETHFSALTLNSANCSTSKTSAANMHTTPTLSIFFIMLSVLWMMV